MSHKEIKEGDNSSGRNLELSGSKSVPPQWSNCMSDSDVNVSVTSTAANTSCSYALSPGHKTPSKVFRSTLNTPDVRKTPHTSGKKKSLIVPRTPSGDERFIPNRSATKFDSGHFKLIHSESDQGVDSPCEAERQKIMRYNLNGRLMDDKILAYRPKPPSPNKESLKVLHTPSKSPCAKKIRHIPQGPERILDAPDIRDDYYLNLLDWSSKNQLAVCLGSTVYLWDAASGDIQQLLQLDPASHDYVGAVEFVPEGNYLAVGVSNGDIQTRQLWDIGQMKKLRTMSRHTSRVASLSWNSYVISSGARSGHIHHYDVRCRDFLVSSIAAHTQEVCGLRWSHDGKLLASGGNDNVLNVWSCANQGRQSESEALHTFTRHTAAVKALAWCPWQSGTLASGGGTADGHINLWNTNTGLHLNSVDTHSQVCCLLWSTSYKELVSSHGHVENQIVIWKYPIMTRVAQLTGHSERVLHLALSPDGSTVVSAGADETLRLWKCFATDSGNKKPSTPGHARDISVALRSCIR